MDCAVELDTVLYMHRASRLRWLALAPLGLALVLVVSCTGDRSAGVVAEGPDASVAAADPAQRAVAPLAGGHGDTSRSVVQHVARVEVSKATLTRPFRDMPSAEAEVDEETGHEPLRPPNKGGAPLPPPEQGRERTEQSTLPVASMPVATHNFHGQGSSTTACTSGCSTPPDTNGAVGPNHYVQSVNVNGTQGLGIWNKSGTMAAGYPKRLNTLFSALGGSDPCAARDDGDPVVVYDQLADRWFITQFALPHQNNSNGPAFQCVAVSTSPDPTGTYHLYEFSYTHAINDYGKFGIWRDAYYATFNEFNANGASFWGADFCAYDRTNMLAGNAATQHCFPQTYPGFVLCGNPPYPTMQFTVFGALPVSLDGPIPPPAGEPGYFMQADFSQCGPNYNQLDLWAMHVDFTTPANSTLTGPTTINVNNFTPTCYANGITGGTGFANCVPQPGTTVSLDGLDDRIMFRLAYRNFGQYESLIVNHSVVGGNGTGGTPGTAGSGIRWYEIQMQPGGTSPTVVQQNTYAPADKNWRWMGSIAQDMAADMALGFAISSNGAAGAVSFPSIGWTGRTNADALGSMGQAESIVDTGSDVEGDVYPGGGPQPDQHRGRWGDYSNMTVDPSDDCTFWYTQELYDIAASNPLYDWDTYIASAKFPNCGQNDFTIGIAPATRSVAQGGSTTYTVTITKTTAGAGEPVTLYIQDLPSGVTLGSFNPAIVPAGGGTSTLTLNVAASAPITGTPSPTFMVIGKATSAVHAATAQIAVTSAACGGAGQACCPGNVCTAPNTCGGGGTAGVCGCTSNNTCSNGHNCGTGADNCGTTITCGNCTAPQTCGGGGTTGMCGCTTNNTCANGHNCGTGADNCGTTITCGTCTAPQTCGGGGTAGMCGCTSNNTCSNGHTCGSGTDNCGTTITCGTCTAPQTCGGGGTAGMCGCTSNNTCSNGHNCGTGTDNCGNTITCGACAAPQTCGGGGTPGMCGGGGCVSNGKCTSGATCGTGTDNCGNTISCGACTAPLTCGGGGTAGQCGCTSNGKCANGNTCGTGADNCGNTVTCGSCTAPQTCGGGGTSGICGCTSNNTCTSGNTCGTGTDNCGNAITCGVCTAPQTCGGGGTPGHCGGGTVNDAGTVDSGGGDGGSGNDGGSTTDAGSKDGGSTGDAGAKDGGSTNDAGAKDGGSTNDAGTHDGGSTGDGGPASDGGATDGGTHADGGSTGHDGGLPLDASLDGGTDTGVVGGCGCVTAGAEDASSSRLALGGFGGLGLIGLIRARRRRTRR
jgi:hypothetical protein